MVGLIVECRGGFGRTFGYLTESCPGLLWAFNATESVKLYIKIEGEHLLDAPGRVWKMK